MMSIRLSLLLLAALFAAGLAPAQDLGPRGRFSAGPNPAIVNSTIGNTVRMTVQNQWAGTFWEVRASVPSGGHSVSVATGRQFISGGASRDFNLTVTPNQITGPLTIALELWGDNDAGDLTRVETRTISLTSIAPPGPFSIVTPEFGTIIQPGQFGITWSASANVQTYTIRIFKMVNGLRQNPPAFARTGVQANSISLNTDQFERGALYQVDLIAVNQIAERLCSNPGHQFQVLPLPTPTEFLLVQPTVGAVVSPTPSFTWGESQNALSYTLNILPEVNGAPVSDPVRVVTGITGTTYNWEGPALERNRTYYASVSAVGENGSRLNTNGLVRFFVPLGDQSLSPVWYFAEGAAFDRLSTFYLLANPNDTSITVNVQFLVESGENRTVTFGVPARGRQTIRANDWVFNTGVSAIITEQSGRSFAAERAMYTLAPDGRWNGAHAVTGVTAPAADWFLAEGATSSLGTGVFQTFILVANPNPTTVAVALTFFPQGGQPVNFTFNVAGGRRLTVEPAGLSAALRGTSFSTRVRTVGGQGVLVERAMWWSNSDWPIDGFIEGNASPGITTLSRNWFMAEGSTRGYDDFLLFVNPNNVTATVKLRYLLATAEPRDREFTLGPNQRFTINVRWDPLGIQVENDHGAYIESTHPIAVERSMYFGAPGLRGPVGGHNAVAMPFAAQEWVLPEGAEFTFSESRLTTLILVANPTSREGTVSLEFLKNDGSLFTVERPILPFRRLTIESDDYPELFGAAFSTVVRADVPIVVERSMLFGTEQPFRVDRLGATSSAGIPVGPITIVPDGTPGAALTTSTFGLLDDFVPVFPTPTPTPTPVPLIVD
jgi:hypothetical protein